VAVDAQPLAHAAGTERGCAVTRRLLVLALLVASPGVVQALDVFPDHYRAAAASGSVGSVTGRVYEERRRPEGADQPLTGAAVTMVPRSPEFLRKLEVIRATARNSVDDYRATVLALQRLKEAYEKELWQSGFPDVVVGTVVQSDGRFSLDNVPSGEWLVIVTRSVAVDTRPVDAASKKKDRGVYTPRTHLTGYQRVTIWLREVTVSSGRPETVELVERNAWFSGVVEERAPDAGR
jgi:hypothetical protein